MTLDKPFYLKPFYFGFFLALIPSAIIFLNTHVFAISSLIPPYLISFLGLIGTIFFFYRRYYIHKSLTDSSVESSSHVAGGGKMLLFYLPLTLCLIAWGTLTYFLMKDAVYGYHIQPEMFWQDGLFSLVLLMFIFAFIPKTAEKAGINLKNVSSGNLLLALSDLGKMLLIFCFTVVIFVMSTLISLFSNWN